MIWRFFMPDYKDLEKAVVGIMQEESYDLHTRTASRLFGTDCANVTPEQRRSAKAYNYGRSYRASPTTLLMLLMREGEKYDSTS